MRLKGLAEDERQRLLTRSGSPASARGNGGYVGQSTFRYEVLGMSTQVLKYLWLA